MDNLRGNFESANFGDDERDYDYADDETGHEPPPAAIGTDERRMQVRAYNHWASQLEDRSFPSIEDLDPGALTDFGPYSVLLDFTAGMDNPGVQFLGEQLATECGTDGHIEELSDVPSRSLLSRITDHYMQILANQAPIGFEAEFVNQRDATILYRGILLPYSSDGETIDFIYGVINWKELADQLTSDELLLEINQALDADEPQPWPAEPVTDWADGPASSGPTGDAQAFGLSANYSQDDIEIDADEDSTMDEDPVISRMASLIHPRKSSVSKLSINFDEDDLDDDEKDPDFSVLSKGFGGAELADRFEADDLDGASETAPDAGLYDCLAEARELALAAHSSEDRTRATLYAAVSRAYDVCLAAQDAPEEFDELVSDNGLTVQDRAPMTPIVKLVFGADYDKTRLTEYASVLSHAQRVGLDRGALHNFLTHAEGGLKGVVAAERRIRKEESGKAVEPADRPREAIAKKLRALTAQSLDSIDPHGAEFGLVMIRRLTTGEVVMLGEVSGDIALIEKVARKLV